MLEELAAVTGATGAYVAERLPVGDADVDADGSAAAKVRYVAALGSDGFMLRDAALAPGQGVTWRVWERPAAEGDESDVAAAEGDADAPPPPPAAPLPPLHVPSLLVEPHAVFFRLPRPGAFLAVPVVYQSVLHAGAVPPPAADDNEGDAGGAPGGDDNAADGGDSGTDGTGAGAAPRPPAPQPAGIPATRRLAVCLDKLAACGGVGVPFTAAQIGAAARVGAALATALQRTEARRFQDEFAFVAAQRAAAAAPERAVEEDAYTAGASLDRVGRVGARAYARVL